MRYDITEEITVLAELYGQYGDAQAGQIEGAAWALSRLTGSPAERIIDEIHRAAVTTSVSPLLAQAAQFDPFTAAPRHPAVFDAPARQPLAVVPPNLQPPTPTFDQRASFGIAEPSDMTDAPNAEEMYPGIGPILKYGEQPPAAPTDEDGNLLPPAPPDPNSFAMQFESSVEAGTNPALAPVDPETLAEWRAEEQAARSTGR